VRPGDPFLVRVFPRVWCRNNIFWFMILAKQLFNSQKHSMAIWLIGFLPARHAHSLIRYFPFSRTTLLPLKPEAFFHFCLVPSPTPPHSLLLNRPPFRPRPFEAIITQMEFPRAPLGVSHVGRPLPHLFLMRPSFHLTKVHRYTPLARPTSSLLVSTYSRVFFPNREQRPPLPNSLPLEFSDHLPPISPPPQPFLLESFWGF